MTVEAKAKAEPTGFPCPACGGSLAFDSESQNLKCRYCGREETIEHLLETPAEHALDLNDGQDDERLDWGLAQQAIRCESCGGETLIPAHRTAGECAFCGSPKVLAQGDARSIRPESVIPFQISKEEAAASFKKWKRKRWFVPNAFKRRDVRSELTGIYIPFWTYDADTVSAYRAERGDYHYRTETRTRVVNGKTETYTETVRYTVWRWTRGTYGRAFDDILVPASKQHEGKLLERLSRFDLSRLVGYRPEYLSGFIAERYTVSRSEGWRSAQERMDDQLRREIIREIGGDEVRNLSIHTAYSSATYKHILLPVWNAGYTYKNKLYRYMVNGQTGLVTGRVPRSPVKIALFVLFCLTIALLTLYLLGSTE